MASRRSRPAALTWVGAVLVAVTGAFLLVGTWGDGPSFVGRENPVVAAVELPAADAGPVLTLPKVPGSLRFAVMGDTGRGDSRQYDTAAEMARWHARFDFAFVLMLGDNNYGTGSHEDYALRFERPYKALLDEGVEFRAALGNHDPPDQVHYRPFNMDGHRYYTFEREYGPLPPLASHRVRFFALDSVTLDDEQVAWIDRQLRESKADWKIAFFHHPLYTSGRYERAARFRRSLLEPVFVAGGLDVAFAGHEHFYERIVPQHGVQYFTSGAGGALRREDIGETDLTAAGFDLDSHFMLIEIAGDTLHFQAVSRTGVTVDAGNIRRATR
jgi:hypothetical protein